MSNNVVEKLHRWAVEEMKYGGAWDAAAMEKISRGPMAGVWAYIATHCKSPQTVQHMMGNLTLARHRLATGGDMSLSSTLQSERMGETERDALLQEKVDLVRRLHSTLAKIKQVKSVIGQHQADRAALDESMAEASSVVTRHEKAATLLALYMRQVQATVKRLKEVKEKLVEAQNRVNNLKTQAKEDRIFSSSAGVETADEKAVRQAVQTIVLHMKRTISEPAGKAERSAARNKVNELVGNISASCLEKALLHQAVNQVYDVKRGYMELDLSAEARKLQLQSQENDNYFLRSVRHEVATFYKRHVESHVAGVNHQAAALAVERNLANVKEMVRARLGGDGWGEKGVAVMQALEAEEAAVRQAAVVSSYRVQMDKVMAAITGMEEEAEETHQLIDKVRRQANAIEDMKDTISGLILINSTVYPRLAELQVANIDVLNVEMQQLGKELGTLLKQLMDRPNMQLRQLNSVPLELLASTRINDRLGQQLVPTVQLGILRNQSGLPQLETGGKHSMEKTVHDIVQLKSVVSRLKRDVDAIKKKRDSSLGSHSPDTVEKLAVLLEKHEKGQEDVVLPLLTDAVERTSRGLQVGGKVHLVMEEWRDQAGQGAVDPEKVVEARTLDQWTDELRVAVARWARQRERRGGPAAL